MLHSNTSQVAAQHRHSVPATSRPQLSSRRSFVACAAANSSSPSDKNETSAASLLTAQLDAKRLKEGRERLKLMWSISQASLWQNLSERVTEESNCLVSPCLPCLVLIVW